MWTLRGDQPVIPGVPFIRLAMAFPYRTTGSLNPGFPPARPVCLAVKLPFAFTLTMTISIRHEGTFERLRYILGGDHPSQTAYQTLSSFRITDEELDFQNSKGGISLMTPWQLTPPLHSLPPMLHMQFQKSMPSCSKGAQGLSVLPRVACIFTSTTNSLSFSSRQRSSRYAIHAGRNFIYVSLAFARDQTISSSCLKYLGVLPSNISIHLKANPCILFLRQELACCTIKLIMPHLSDQSLQVLKN